jgi:hypothetical protein
MLAGGVWLRLGLGGELRLVSVAALGTLSIAQHTLPAAPPEVVAGCAMFTMPKPDLVHPPARATRSAGATAMPNRARAICN